MELILGKTFFRSRSCVQFFESRLATVGDAAKAVYPELRFPFSKITEQTRVPVPLHTEIAGVRVSLDWALCIGRTRRLRKWQKRQITALLDSSYWHIPPYPVSRKFFDRDIRDKIVPACRSLLMFYLHRQGRRIGTTLEVLTMSEIWFYGRGRHRVLYAWENWFGRKVVPWP